VLAIDPCRAQPPAHPLAAVRRTARKPHRTPVQKLRPKTKRNDLSGSPNSPARENRPMRPTRENRPNSPMRPNNPMRPTRSTAHPKPRDQPHSRQETPLTGQSRAVYDRVLCCHWPPAECGIKHPQPGRALRQPFAPRPGIFRFLVGRIHGLPERGRPEFPPSRPEGRFLPVRALALSCQGRLSDCPTCPDGVKVIRALFCGPDVGYCLANSQRGRQKWPL
jgi:hypothetical protein